MKNYQIVKLAEYAERNGENTTSLLNAARRQTIPAFRERGSWMIGVDDGIFTKTC
ncbi:MAG: hypothetical protein LBM97_02215 [Candidatus Nomurabacteria bacterium]|nr:hypothetical protein [Candidatus Nomurabacteria bacterium]